MSFYSDASLVLIPSGYKDQKVYSAVPTDGSGDLVFSRASSATRVASNGLIEKVRENLILQSQTFQTSWGLVNASVSADATTAPDGTTTADKLLDTIANNQHRIEQSSVSSAGSLTFSLYAKKGDYDFIWLRIGFLGAYFNLTNGNISVISSGITASAVDAGNGWYRCIITDKNAAANAIIRISLATTSGATDFVGTGTSGNFIWGAQYEQGDIATDYIPTTTTAVSVGPVSGLPRLDYTNSTCPKLLLEPQRTNSALYSEQFDNAAWSKLNATVTANTIVSPDGTQNADKFVENNGTGQKWIYNVPTVISGSVYTYSVFAKKGERDFIYINAFSSGNFRAWFNLNTGTIGTIDVGASAKIENYGNGWYKCSVTFTAATGTNFYLLGVSNANNVIDYTGDGTSGIYIWGAQNELGAYATSYVKTEAAAVSRLADAASKTGISSLIGQTEGVMFIDMEFEGYDGLPKWIAFLGTGADYIGIYTNTTSKFTVEVAVAGAAQFVNSSYTFSVGQRYKLALAYKANDFAFYVNGTQVATDNSGTVPATGQFDLQYNTNANNLTARTYNQALLFKTRLTNAQLAELTTL